MNESMDDVRYDIGNTRQRMSGTLAALESEIGARKDAVAGKVRAVKSRMDPHHVGELVRQHPWAAMAVALGVGALFARSGADRAVVTGTAHAATSASRSTADAVRSAATSVVQKVKGEGDAEVRIDAQRDAEDSLVDRAAGHLGRVIRIEELETDMRRAFVSQKLPTSI